MPIYEYTCKACDHSFEQLVRTMNPDAAAKCPECGSSKTARALSVFATNTSGGGTQGSSADADPMCGRCGGAPGSCGMG